MQVIISCPGKFHIFDVATFFEKYGVLAKVISGYPYFLLKNATIPKDKIYSIPVQYLSLLKQKIKLVNSFFPYGLEPVIFDYVCSKYLKNVDLFHGFPNWMLKSSRESQKKEIIVVAEGSSTHILYREKILQIEFKKLKIKFYPHNPLNIKRQLEEYEISNYILVPSEFAGKSYIEYGLPKEKIIKIPYGVTDLFFKEYPRKKKEEIIIVGTIGIVKGTHYLLEAYRRLKGKDKRLRLHLIGFFREDMKEIIRKNSDLIDFIGVIKKKDLPEYFSNVDIFIQPSLQEGFSILILEAMASGLPVIVSTNTGVNEIIKNGEDGLIVPICDSQAIYDKLKFLIENENMRISIGENARKKAKLYTWERYADEYIRIFEDIVKKRKN